MVWNLDDTIKKQKYNLNGQNIYTTSVYNYLSGFYFLQP